MDQIISLIGCALSVFAMLALQSLGIHIIRLGWKKIIGKPWTRWYVRRAVDATIFGHLVMWFFLVNTESPFKDWMRMSFKVHGVHVEKLAFLIVVDDYLKHLCPFVIMPALLVGLAGYAVERHQATRKEAQHIG